MAHWLKSIAAGLAVFLALGCLPGQAEASVKKANDRGGSLGVIVEKDLFRPSRQKPKPPKPKPKPKPPAEPVVVLPPPKSPPPRLTLSGTILLDSGNVALLSLQSAGGGSGSYRTGDEIEGFRITDIASESVTLMRDEEILRVFMNAGQGGTPAAPAVQRVRSQNTAAQYGPPADIPPALVPRPPAHFQRAPYR